MFACVSSLLFVLSKEAITGVKQPLVTSPGALSQERRWVGRRGALKGDRGVKREPEAEEWGRLVH